jgi:hypothetical protein
MLRTIYSYKINVYTNGQTVRSLVDYETEVPLSVGDEASFLQQDYKGVAGFTVTKIVRAIRFKEGGGFEDERVEENGTVTLFYIAEAAGKSNL